MRTERAARWRRATLASIVGGVILSLVFADPAMAADEIQVSSDGATYSNTLASPLLDGFPVLVPMDSASVDFWVRNDGPSQAYLSVTLENATWSSQVLADAITVGASVPGNGGQTVVLSNPSACAVLLEGFALDAGQAVRVTMTLAVGDLNGTDGQNATAGMDAGISLTETAGLPAGPSCTTPPTTVVVVPPAPGAVPRPPATGPGAGAPDAGGDAVDDGGAVDGEPGEPAEPTSPIEELAAVLTNTLTSFDPIVVLFAALAVPAGAVLSMIVGKVRRREGDITEETP